MGCCNSRLKDAKENSNCNGEDERAEGDQRTINGLIASNMRKRQKSFITIAQKKLALQNGDYK